MTLKYKYKPTRNEVQAGYRLGRQHMMLDIDGISHEENPYPHDERGWAYLDGMDDYGNRWDESRGGKPPRNLDVKAEQLHRYGPRARIDSSLLRSLGNLYPDKKQP